MSQSCLLAELDRNSWVSYANIKLWQIDLDQQT